MFFVKTLEKDTKRGKERLKKWHNVGTRTYGCELYKFRLEFGDYFYPSIK